MLKVDELKKIQFKNFKAGIIAWYFRYHENDEFEDIS